MLYCDTNTELLLVIIEHYCWFASVLIRKCFSRVHRFLIRLISAQFPSHSIGGIILTYNYFLPILEAWCVNGIWLNNDALCNHNTTHIITLNVCITETIMLFGSKYSFPYAFHTITTKQIYFDLVEKITLYHYFAVQSICVIF